MSWTTLSLTLIFVLIPLLLSKTLHLGLERDTIVATIRSTVQLIAVGYVLKFVFDSEHPVFIMLMVLLMIIAAVQNARHKGKAIKGITWKLFVTFAVIEVATQTLLLGLPSPSPGPPS